ncbi:MAG: phosphatase PAP2 family protein [Xenococcaceae cyanobacterium]
MVIKATHNMIIDRKKSKIEFLVLLFISVPFLILCHQILEQKYPEIDFYIADLIQTKTNPIFEFLLVTFYRLTGVYVTAIVVATALGILVWKRYWQEATVLAFASLGILILVDEILKPFFDRRRPPGPRLVEVSGSKSYPSGHAAGNFVFYFYLSFVIATRFPQYIKYVYGLSTLITLIIGYSSIYVKAHWATDILAGYVFGYLWLIICLTILKFSNSKYR